MMQPINAQLLTLQADNASFASRWIECLAGYVLSTTFAWRTNLSGALVLQGTDDPAQAAGSIVPLTIPTGALHSSQHATVSLDAQGVIQLAAAPAGALACINVDLPRFLRWSFTRTAGGAAADLDAWYAIRGPRF